MFVCVLQAKLVSELQNKLADLQSRLSDVERSAEDHLRSLATHTESAIDAAQQRLSTADERQQEHSKFIKVLNDIGSFSCCSHAFLNCTRKCDVDSS